MFLVVDAISCLNSEISYGALSENTGSYDTVLLSVWHGKATCSRTCCAVVLVGCFLSSLCSSG